MATRRQKRFNKSQRLASAKHWIPTYTGKNIVKGYRKWYGVGLPCAIRELEIFGVEIDPEYKEKIFKLEEAKHQAALKRKEQKEQGERDKRNGFDPSLEQDDYFYCIVGYTSGGCAYGVTWEEYRTELRDKGEE